MIHVKSSLWVRPSYCLFALETIRNISINTTLFVKKNLQIVGGSDSFLVFLQQSEHKSSRSGTLVAIAGTTSQSYDKLFWKHNRQVNHLRLTALDLAKKEN